MKVMCTVRRVVDPESKPKIGANGSLDLGGASFKLNPFDEYGVEEAIRLKEKGQADEIVVVCVGNDECDKEIRAALAMGATRGVRVDVEDDTALDTLTVARLLAEVAKKEEPDLILMGKLSVDTEGNQVGQMLAEYLGWGQGTFAFKLDIDGGSAVVGREVDGGTMTVKLALPAVVTADLRLNEPRYASLPGIMQAKKKPLDVIDPDDLDIEIEPKVTTVGYELPPARAEGVKVGSVDELVAKLRNEAKVI
jgi:electron transfer flavoprotein beta subunit